MTKLAHAPLDLSKARRLLIVKPSSLGDIVHTLPSLHDIKASFPHLEITWLANTEWLPLLDGHPQLRKTLEFPRSKFRGARGFISALRWLNALHHHYQPDVTLDFQGLFRSGAIAWFSHARHRLGLSDAREGAGLFLNYRVEVPSDIHAVDRYRHLSAAVGADISQPPVFQLPLGSSMTRALPPTFVALHPFSRGEGKSLTISQINAFCATSPLPVVLVGRCDPAWICQLALRDQDLDLLNKTSLSELITCLRRSAATISVDSGPMHLAAALQPDRLLGIHTWSDPRKVGPYAATSWVWKAGTIARKDALLSENCAQKARFPDEAIHEIQSWLADRL